MLVKVASGLFIRPDSAVNGFVADADDVGLPQGAGDLFGAPFELEQIDHRFPGSRVNSQIAPGATSAPPGVHASLGWPIEPVMSSTVSLQLSADGAGVSVEGACDLSLRKALPVQAT